MKQVLISILALTVATGTASAEPQRFETPEAAVSALIAALESRDRAAVLAIFGPENEDVVSTGDAAEDRENWTGFLTDAQAIHRIEVESDDRAILHAGTDDWPFPAAILRKDGQWGFDAESAREEVLARRIGRHEMEVIGIMRRAADVQSEYRKTDHDGDGVLEFAASILSSPGQRDGLYWPEEPGTEASPFDELLARASSEGFGEDGTDHDPDPYEGYYFRILQGQGEKAPGGAYSYMLGGNMVAGHALVAYPAVYGDTGIMSFVIGEAGVLYQSDLGEDTLAKAGMIELFDPGPDWVLAE